LNADESTVEVEQHPPSPTGR